MKKKLLVLCLCVVMVAALVISCAPAPPAAEETADEPAAEATATPTTNVQAQSRDEDATAEEEADGSAEDVVEGEDATTGEEESYFKPEDGSGYVIGFCNSLLGNTWRQQFVEETENHLKMYQEQGIVDDYMISSANADVTEQMNQINAMVNAGVDAIVLDPVSATAMAASVEAAQEAGILVVNCNEVAPYEGTYSISCDISVMGAVQMKYICEALEGEGNFVYVTGTPGYASDDVRTAKSEEVLKDYPNVKMLASEPGKWSQSEAQTVMSTFLATYGDEIDAVLCQDVMSEGILQAYANAGATPEIVSGDCIPSFLNIWKNDYPDLKSSCIPALPYAGTWGVDLAIGLLQGKTINEDLLVPNWIDPEMINLIEWDMPYVILNERDIDAMPEFISWLKEALPYTQILTIEDALAIAEGKPDSYTIGFTLTNSDLTRIFG